jgi:hypothetical protein
LGSPFGFAAIGVVEAETVRRVSGAISLALLAVVAAADSEEALIGQGEIHAQLSGRGMSTLLIANATCDCKVFRRGMPPICVVE